MRTMVKSRSQFTRNAKAAPALFLAALMLGSGFGAKGADQSTAQPASPAKPAPVDSSHKKTARPPQTPAEHKRAAAGEAALAAGRRDPFKIPDLAVNRSGAVSGLPGVLPVGNRGLVISQLRLEGIVLESENRRMTAVVVNETKVAHFLHENDMVFNGVVTKITPDAIYFRENVLDAKGHVTTREVIKRVGSAPGEGR